MTYKNGQYRPTLEQQRTMYPDGYKVNKKVVQLAAEVASYMTDSPFANHERILALVEAVRQDTLNELGKSGVLSWGKVAEIQNKD